MPRTRCGWLWLLCLLVSSTGLAESAREALRAPWEFYWQRWLTPTDQAAEPDYALDAASGWNHLIDKKSGQALGPSGWGTYRKELSGFDPRAAGYELQFPFISTASRIWVFEKTHPDTPSTATTGRIGLDQKSMIPQIREAVVRFHPTSRQETWVVLVQVSNSYHSLGGILTMPELAAAPVISERAYKDELGYIFSMGVILVVCIYNVMLFARRREDYSSLMLALFCLTAAARTFANGNLVNLFFTSDNPFAFLLKYFLEYSTLVLEPLTYAAFIHLSFRNASWSRVIPTFTVICSVATLMTLLLLPITYGRFLPLYQTMIVVQAVFSLVVMFRALFKGLEGAKLALGSGIVLSLTIAYDILVSYNVFPQPYIMQYGIDVFVFLQSQVVARRFATAFRTAERLQNELQIEVERQTQDIRSMMEHVPQGIFLVLDDMTIQPHYSRHLEDILGKKSLGGRVVTDLLFEGRCITLEQKSIIDTIMLSAFGSDMFAWDVNSWQLPKELFFIRTEGQHRILEIDWNPVVGKALHVERLLVTIRDVTNMRALQAENKHRQAELDCLIELLGTIPGTLPRFFEQATLHLERSRSQLNSIEAPEQIKRMVFIELHSLKGLSRSQGLRRLAAAVHEAEQHYVKDKVFDRSKLKADAAELNDLLDEYKHVFQQKMSREANKGAELHMERSHLVVLEEKLNPLREDKSVNGATRELIYAVQDFLSVYLYREAQHVFDDLMHEVERLARELGKEKPRLTLLGMDSLLLLPQTERMVQTCFLHVVRNSMDHGIESASERLSKGKAAEGHILIELQAAGEQFLVVYRDDGRGINLAQIEKKAREKGLWQEDRPMNVAEATEMLFHSGFSTRDQVSEISGRGVGLDAVRMACRELGGDVCFHLEGIDPTAVDNIPFRLLGTLPAFVARQSRPSMKKVS